MSSRAGLLTEASLAALLWLVVANAVGLLLATLLLLPELGSLFAPVTYGRLLPLHLNLELYGWTTFPLVALFARTFVAPGDRGLLPRLALQGYSAALGLGAASWLAGMTTGKIFLDWQGPARWALLTALAGLELAFAASWVRRVRADGALAARAVWGGSALLALLAAVPVALAFATRPETYPPINPSTGGPTGGSLLGSSLGLAGLFLACPWLLGRPLKPAASRRTLGAVLGLFALHGLAFGLLDHGDHSHRELTQLLALCSLLAWPPLLVLALRSFRWPAGAGRWLWSFGAWGALLTASAVATFSPGVLDRLKFTNALVAHAHLAMAGMLSSFLLLALTALGEETGLGPALGRARPFWLWQAGSAVMVLALTAVGFAEGGRPALILERGGLLDAAYVVRLAAGALLLSASVTWLCSALAARRVAARGELCSFERRAEPLPAERAAEAA